MKELEKSSLLEHLERQGRSHINLVGPSTEAFRVSSAAREGQ